LEVPATVNLPVPNFPELGTARLFHSSHKRQLSASFTTLSASIFIEASDLMPGSPPHVPAAVFGTCAQLQELPDFYQREAKRLSAATNMIRRTASSEKDR
jgi:hypothetical protein